MPVPPSASDIHDVSTSFRKGAKRPQGTTVEAVSMRFEVYRAGKGHTPRAEEGKGRRNHPSTTVKGLLPLYTTGRPQVQGPERSDPVARK